MTLAERIVYVWPKSMLADCNTQSGSAVLVRQAHHERRFPRPFALRPSPPFVLSLSKERTVLRTGLSKGEFRVRGSTISPRTAMSPSL